MTPDRVTPPAETPVDLAWIKGQLRVEHNEHDAELIALIQAATEHLDGYEGILGRALVSQTWQANFAGFSWPGFRLPLRPVQSVTSFVYSDSANADQTFPPENYRLVNGRSNPTVQLAGTGGWSTWPYSRSDAVRVTFLAGYGSAADVPAPIKSAIKLHVEMHYDTSVDQKVWRERFEALIANYRVSS